MQIMFKMESCATAFHFILKLSPGLFIVPAQVKDFFSKG